MWEDPIVAEVRRVRAAHAAQFNNDLLAIYRNLKAQEEGWTKHKIGVVLRHRLTAARGSARRKRHLT